MSRTGAVLIAGSILFSLPLIAEGHTAGASLEAESGNYLVDIGYDPEPLEAGTSALFDFSLLSRESQKVVVPYSHVWVRIRDAEGGIFASGIHRQAVGATTLLYVFPKEGVYTLEASFRGEDGEVAEASFEVSVLPNSSQPFSESILFAPLMMLLGALFGAAGLSLLRERSVGKSPEGEV